MNWRSKVRLAARGVACVVFWIALSTGVALARDPDPVLRIPLEPIGYQSMVPEFLLSGSSMLTVHFVDESHLLVTFALRRLMKREANDPPDDEDRTVGAFLVELPSGKVLARTEWRLHDRGQYLWDLGHGRFLLRVRDRLSMVAPMTAATPDDAFRDIPFLENDRHILAMLVSADSDLLTIETADRQQGQAVPHFAGDAPGPIPLPVQINFYRLSIPGGKATDKLVVASAGVLRSRVALALPLTTAGFLDVLEGGRDRWLFNFDVHAGKVSELAEFNTTCYPRTTFVNHSEFVAFGCRGSSDKQSFAGFNLKGEEMWQQNFFDTQILPTFAFAPAAGRFALGRTIVSSAGDSTMPFSPGVANSQEVRVYQMYSGKQLLRIECTPIIRAGQNFALSPDGMQLAVVRETMLRHPATKTDDAYTSRTAAVEIYALPALSNKDQVAVKEAQGFAPEDTGARIDLALQRQSGPPPSDAQAANAMTGSTAAVPGSASAPGSPEPALPALPVEESLPAAEQSAPAEASAAGDPVDTAPRKPPTLYGPGEAPAGKSPR